MSRLRLIYLGLAVLGLIVPALALLRLLEFSELGVTAILYIWVMNPIAFSGVAATVLATLTMTVWVLSETWVRKNWVALWVIPATFFVGLSFGLPLYLFLRTRPVT